MDALLNELRWCDKGIEFWNDIRVYVAGEREQKLSVIHARRGLLLGEIREHSYWRYGP